MERFMDSRGWWARRAVSGHGGGGLCTWTESGRGGSSLRQVAGWERRRGGAASAAATGASGWRVRRRGGRGGALAGGIGGMGRLRWQVVAVAVVGLALALEALPSALRWLRAGRRRRRPRREVLFFPSQVTCTEVLLQAPDAAPLAPSAGCGCSLPHGESSLSRLLRALLAARASLELCLFAFSSPQLGRAVQLLHQRGVRVRVITDCDYMALNGSQIGLLRKAGR